MTRFEAQTVRQQLGNIKQMDKVIDILLGKADKDFTTFLKMLQDSNNKVWAEELERRAEQFKEEGTLCVERRGQSEVHAVLNVKLMQFSLLKLGVGGIDKKYTVPRYFLKNIAVLLHTYYWSS